MPYFDIVPLSCVEIKSRYLEGKHSISSRSYTAHNRYEFKAKQNPVAKHTATGLSLGTLATLFIVGCKPLQIYPRQS